MNGTPASPVTHLECVRADGAVEKESVKMERKIHRCIDTPAAGAASTVAAGLTTWMPRMTG